LSSEEDDIYIVIKIRVTKIKFERIADIYWCALWGDWSDMEPIFKNDPDSVLIPLTKTGDTALHVAAGAGNTNFVKELTKLMKTEYQVIPNSEGMLAVHLAALSGHHRIVKHLCSQQHLLDKMAYKDIQKLFFMTIGNDMFGKCIYNSLNILLYPFFLSNYLLLLNSTDMILYHLV